MNVCSVRTHMHADRYTDTGQILLGHFIVNRKKRKRGVRAGRLGGVVVVVVVVVGCVRPVAWHGEGRVLGRRGAPFF